MTLPDVFTESIDTLLEIEQLTASKATAPFSEPFSKVLAMLLAIWPGDDASDAAKSQALARLNTEALMSPMAEVERVILKGATEALSHGIDAGLAQAGTRGKTFKRTLPMHLRVAVTATQRVARARVDTGTALLRTASTMVEAQAALAVSNPAPAVSAQARWLTNRASNEGILTVADASPGVVTVWVAERDGCVHCLAYQGHKRERMGYPAGLTFGKKALSDKPVSMPPLHPNCRCTQLVLKTIVAQPVIDGLLREAQRSILRGWSVESESNSVRVDAARRLLAKNPSMPKSVQTYARSAIKAGKFKRGRDFPV
jgi:hypothetical protein